MTSTVETHAGGHTRRCHTHFPREKPRRHILGRDKLSYQKLVQSDNSCSSYRQRCSDIFFSETPWALTQFRHWGSCGFFISSLPFFPLSFPFPCNPAIEAWGSAVSSPSGSGLCQDTKCILVHLEAKIKRFMGQISCIF